jgi:predicted nucleotidyltransferase component of viral defense system
MIELLQERLARYPVADSAQQTQSLKEILQEMVLYALWRNDFFELAAFQGGTCLRILYGLPRFSEDLDFILKSPDPGFRWSVVLAGVTEVLQEFGVVVELVDRGRADRAVQMAMLKDDSLGGQLELKFVDAVPRRKLRVKLEVDTHPPAGSGWDQRFHDFPTDFLVSVQDLPSNFALKLHALLCRPYVKGRDWYDFLWYLRRSTVPNLVHLQHALQQSGPFAGKEVVVDAVWLQQVLAERIRSLDWAEVVRDVEPFLHQTERRSLGLWGPALFTERTENLYRLLLN